MADINVELQTHVHINNENVQETSINETNSVGEEVSIVPFVWLESWIMYFPMVVRSKIKKDETAPRNRVLITLFLLIAIVVTVGECLWYSIPPYYYDWADNKLFCLVYSAAMILMAIAKFISVYYFWKHFQFQTLRNISLDPNSFLGAKDSTQMIQKVNVRMKIMLFLLISCLISLIGIKIGRILTDDSDWISLIRSVLYFWMFDVPLLISQLVLSIFYFKGCVFISHLHDMIKNNPQVDFVVICDKYRKFRSKFKSSIKLLEYMLICRICAVFAWIWIDISSILEKDASVLFRMQTIVYFIMDTIPFIELVLSGHSATTKYYAFKKAIYEIKDLSLQLIYFMDCMVQYPFLVKIFAKEVSLKNGLKVTAAFVIAKILSYLFKTHLIR